MKKNYQLIIVNDGSTDNSSKLIKKIIKNKKFDIKYIEKKMGRVISPKNYPRICDIDIIDFNNLSLNLLKENIIVPHPRMHNRNFVLIPLYEINKKWNHPKFKKNIVKLISNLSNSDLRGVKIT